MAFNDADLRMADDHVAQGERHITRQHQIIEELRSRGHSTTMAEQLLIEFEATLAQHRAHRDTMVRSNSMLD